jgi:hypothetical protein
MRGTPCGFEKDVEENEHGWAVWKREKGCAGCEKKEDEDGEQMMAFSCPECGDPGCDECMPSGRGCLCPSCEEAEYNDD